jgi:hypothetical protein
MPNVWYDEWDYADTRLRGSVVGSKIGPVEVVNVAPTADGEPLCHVYQISSSNQSVLRLGDLDMTPLPLGFANMGPDAGYLYRSPARRYKQGLTTATLRSAHFRFRLPNSLMNFKPLLQPVDNKYPTIEESLEMLDDYFGSVAVSRDVALTDKGKVLWRTTPEPVGTVNWDNGVLTLDEKFKFLSDVMALKFGANRIL